MESRCDCCYLESRVRQKRRFAKPGSIPVFGEKLNPKFRYSTHMTVVSSISLQHMRKPFCSLFPLRGAPCMPCQRLGVPGRTVREVLICIRDHPATVLDQHRLPVHLPSSIRRKFEIVSHPLQTCIEQLEIIALEREVNLSARTSFTFESVTMSSTAKIIAAIHMLSKSLAMLRREFAKHGTHRPVHASRSCCRPVISAWLALKIHASDQGEKSAKFSHCWRRQLGAAAGGQTLSGRNWSRKCPDNL